MKNRNSTVPNAIPNYVEARDVLGQTKPTGINVIQRFKYRHLNAPDLNVIYAGLGKRTIAKFIDLIVVLIPSLILETFLFKFDFANNDFNIYRLLIAVVLWIFYNGIFETSVYEATIGKMILKLKVIDLYGKRINVLRSFFRCITTMISILPFGLGIWYITTDPKKRSWHDLISGTYVIKYEKN